MNVRRKALKVAEIHRIRMPGRQSSRPIRGLQPVAKVSAKAVNFVNRRQKSPSMAFLALLVPRPGGSAHRSGDASTAAETQNWPEFADKSRQYDSNLVKNTINRENCVCTGTALAEVAIGGIFDEQNPINGLKNSFKSGKSSYRPEKTSFCRARYRPSRLAAVLQRGGCR